jgi:hypothetical protein
MASDSTISNTLGIKSRALWASCPVKLLRQTHNPSLLQAFAYHSSLAHRSCKGTQAKEICYRSAGAGADFDQDEYSEEEGDIKEEEGIEEDEEIEEGVKHEKEIGGDDAGNFKGVKIKSEE